MSIECCQLTPTETAQHLLMNLGLTPTSQRRSTKMANMSETTKSEHDDPPDESEEIDAKLSNLTSKPPPPPRISSMKTTTTTNQSHDASPPVGPTPPTQSKRHSNPKPKYTSSNLPPYQPRPSAKSIFESYQADREEAGRKPAIKSSGTNSPSSILLWAKNFHSLLIDREGVEAFQAFLQEADESLAKLLEFYYAVHGLRNDNSEQKRPMFHAVYGHYIGSPDTIPLENRLRLQLTSKYQQLLALEKNVPNDPAELIHAYNTFFDEAQCFVEQTLGNAPYNNFMESYLQYFHDQQNGLMDQPGSGLMDQPGSGLMDQPGSGLMHQPGSDSCNTETVPKPNVSSEESSNNMEPLSSTNNTMSRDTRPARNQSSGMPTNPEMETMSTRVDIPTNLVSKLATSKRSIEVDFFPPNSSVGGTITSDGNATIATTGNNSQMVSNYRKTLEHKSIFPYSVTYSTVVRNSTRDTEVSSSSDSAFSSGIAHGGHASNRRQLTQGPNYSQHSQRFSRQAAAAAAAQHAKNRHHEGVDPTTDHAKFAALIRERLLRIEMAEFDQGSNDQISVVLAQANSGGVGGHGSLKEFLKKKPIPTQSIPESDQTILDKHCAQVFETPNSGTPTGQPYLGQTSAGGVGGGGGGGQHHNFAPNHATVIDPANYTAELNAPVDCVQLTTALIRFADEEYPYKLQFPGTRITLAYFKAQCATLPNKRTMGTNLAYYFRRETNEDEKRKFNRTAYIYELIKDEGALLPTCDGEIMATISML